MPEIQTQIGAGSESPPVAGSPQRWDVVVLEVGHMELLPDQSKTELCDTLNYYLPRPGAEIHIKAHGANSVIERTSAGGMKPTSANEQQRGNPRRGGGENEQ